MTSTKPLGRGSIRVRRKARRAGAGVEPQQSALAQNWRSEFLAKLAETSNVRQSCEAAGVNPSTVYDLRRRDAGFAQRWLDALCEGYDNLEMEMLHHLRSGERGDAPKFNFAVALRMLLAHRETVNREKARRIDVDVEDVRASIDHKIAMMRESVLARRAAGSDSDDRDDSGDRGDRGDSDHAA